MKIVIWIVIILLIILAALAYWQLKTSGVLVERERELTAAERQALVASIQIPRVVEELTPQERKRMVDSVKIQPAVR